MSEAPREFIVSTASGLAGLLHEEILELGCEGQPEGDSTVRLTIRFACTTAVSACSPPKICVPYEIGDWRFCTFYD